MPFPISVAKTIPGRMPNAPARRFFQNGVRVAPRYMVTTSPGKQFMILRKKHRNRALSCCFPIMSPKRGYFRTNLLIASIPDAFPIKYGMVRMIMIPAKLIPSAVQVENKCPTAISKMISGKNTVTLFRA